jgi:hypothetical protein
MDFVRLGISNIYRIVSKRMNINNIHTSFNPSLDTKTMSLKSPRARAVVKGVYGS